MLALSLWQKNTTERPNQDRRKDQINILNNNHRGGRKKQFSPHEDQLVQGGGGYDSTYFPREKIEPHVAGKAATKTRHLLFGANVVGGCGV